VAWKGAGAASRWARTAAAALVARWEDAAGAATSRWRLWESARRCGRRLEWKGAEETAEET
jgi:hypothetical protein